MLMKVLPGYDSKEGDIVEWSRKYESVMSLLERFIGEGTFFSSLPAISVGRQEEHKSRLMLLFHTSRILETYESYAESDNIYDIANYLKQNRVPLDITGYWNECGGKLDSTTFWQMEPTMEDGVFFATKWHKDADAKLTGIKYALCFNEFDDDKIIAYIIHPEFIVHRMSGLAYGDSDHVWYVIEKPKRNKPSVLSFKRFLASSVWCLKMDLHYVTDEKCINQYEKWLANCEIVKPYSFCEYSFQSNLYAVTINALYIPAEEDGVYFKVPRDAVAGFEWIKIGDNVGTMTIKDEIYLAFDELLLYVKTSPDELKKYGIERVCEIE